MGPYPDSILFCFLDLRLSCRNSYYNELKIQPVSQYTKYVELTFDLSLTFCKEYIVSKWDLDQKPARLSLWPFEYWINMYIFKKNQVQSFIISMLLLPDNSELYNKTRTISPSKRTNWHSTGNLKYQIFLIIPYITFCTCSYGCFIWLRLSHNPFLTVQDHKMFVISSDQECSFSNICWYWLGVRLYISSHFNQRPSIMFQVLECWSGRLVWWGS